MSYTHAEFASTSWTVVVKATGADGASQAALQDLCRSYWYPVFAYLRKIGMQTADAEDATQSFFAWAVHSNVVSRADPERGRFRVFLIVALKQFLSRRRQYENAAKRAPATPLLSLEDIQTGDSRFRLESNNLQTPEQLYERTWAVTVIESVLARLRAEWEAAGKRERFDILKSRLVDPDESTSGLAAQLGISEAAVRVAVHRLRRRFAELLRQEVSTTVNDAHSTDDEIGQLLAALRVGN